MRRRPQPLDSPSVPKALTSNPTGNFGLVLSGGGSRAAYQVGALKALAPYIKAAGYPIVSIMGSSIGSVNGLVFSAFLKDGIDAAVEQIEALWLERTYRNTFAGSPSRAFLRAVKTAILQYRSPGPEATSSAIFDPTPLMQRIDSVIDAQGSLRPEARDPELRAVGVMTTIEGKQRKPLLFVSSVEKLQPEFLAGASFDVAYIDALTAKHGLASAALPSIMPPVELDLDVGRVRLVDGGISHNIPVDPAVRFGAERVIVLDISGRQWWADRYGRPHDERPDWEVPSGVETFCFRPPESFVMKNTSALGPILQAAVGHSTKEFMSALGATWPIFTLVKKRLGEDIAYEVLSYVALHPEYSRALIEQGYNDTIARLRTTHGIEFTRMAKHSDAKVA